MKSVNGSFSHYNTDHDYLAADAAGAQQPPPIAQKRTPAPSTESLMRSSDAAGAAAGSAHQQRHQQQQQRPFSRTSSVKTSTSALASSSSRDVSRPPSAIENHLDYLREPVVKTPTEPTRVKSPEGSVRSPDPINWTVPLDTGKTFSVTQSLKDGGGTDPSFVPYLCNWTRPDVNGLSRNSLLLILISFIMI